MVQWIVFLVPFGNVKRSVDPGRRAALRLADVISSSGVGGCGQKNAASAPNLAFARRLAETDAGAETTSVDVLSKQYA